MPIDYTKYPPDWPHIREQVLDRAGHKCERCGLPNGHTVWSVPFKVVENGKSKARKIWFRNWDDAVREAPTRKKVKAVKVVLTVMHLDHDAENWEVDADRLLAACQACHLRYDSESKSKARKNEG